MIDKPLGSITAAELESLVKGQVVESKTLDYKADWYGGADADKKELLKDVTAFANTAGGDIVFGIAEADGIPQSPIAGLDKAKFDDEIRRMTEVLHHGLEPKTQFEFSDPIDTGDGKACLVLRVPESYLKPHRVVFRGQNGDFWFRHDRQRLTMDTDELRRQFTFAGAIEEKIRAFVSGRIAVIQSGHTPVKLENHYVFALHLIPLQSFTTRTQINIADPELPRFLIPLGARGCNWRLNLDGLLTFSGDGTRPQRTYLQLYRNGVIEAVSGDFGGVREDGIKFVSPQYFIQYMVKQLRFYLDGLSKAGVESRIWMFVTILNAEGAPMPTRNFDPSFIIDRSRLDLPEVLIDDYRTPTKTLVRPIFDMLWQSAGYERCPYYLDDGRVVANEVEL